MSILKPNDFTNCPRCGSDNCQDVPRTKDIVGTLIAAVAFSFFIYIFAFHFPALWYLLIAMPFFVLFLILKPSRKRLCLDCKKVWEYRVAKRPKA